MRSHALSYAIMASLAILESTQAAPLASSSTVSVASTSGTAGNSASVQVGGSGGGDAVPTTVGDDSLATVKLGEISAALPPAGGDKNNNNNNSDASVLIGAAAVKEPTLQSTQDPGSAPSITAAVTPVAPPAPSSNSSISRSNDTAPCHMGNSTANFGGWRDHQRKGPRHGSGHHRNGTSPKDVETPSDDSLFHGGKGDGDEFKVGSAGAAIEAAGKTAVSYLTAGDGSNGRLLGPGDQVAHDDATYPNGAQVSVLDTSAVAAAPSSAAAAAAAPSSSASVAAAAAPAVDDSTAQNGAMTNAVSASASAAAAAAAADAGSGGNGGDAGASQSDVSVGGDAAAGSAAGSSKSAVVASTDSGTSANSVSVS
ncbi:unnamed protein product [Discula destructiva]